MKIEIKIVGKKKEQKYPALYKAKSLLGHTVMFFGASYGMVVDNGSGNFNLMMLSDDWVSCHDKANWERLPEGSQVTFTQE